MFIAATAPRWLAGPAERRLREISTVVEFSARPRDYALMLSEDVMALQELTADIQCYINVCNAPILRLSPEVLSLIIESCANVARRHMDIFWLGQVCHQFRSVLLGMHSLWGDIVTSVKAEAREEVLSRAGSAGIVLYFDERRRRNSPDLVDFMGINVKCARSLTCKASQVDSLPWSPRDLCALDLPHLEELVVDLTKDPWQSTDARDIGSLHAPALKSVDLRDIFIPFPPHNLAFLCLQRHEKTAEFKGMSFGEFTLFL